MNHHLNRRSRVMRRLAIFFVALFVVGSADVATAASERDELRRLRAERRSASRRAQLAAAKTSRPSAFGLLVIPVDFADARLPSTWCSTDLAARLYDDDESLRRYFTVASNGRLDLQIGVAPVVHLPEERLAYSDIGWNGFFRTRRLATEALEAVVGAGFALRAFDNDGPDGLPGGADDDGLVDGVLILHAGIGQENDLQDGRIQALQYFLDEPVVAEGVAASFYAVASMRSGPGIWAHETAHLLGLEDRYDPTLGGPTASEVSSRGGLGRYSLMAAGLWGTGDGFGAALPDAYSLAQLGWCDVREVGYSTAAGDTLSAIVSGGEAHRVWSAGEAGYEYFLLEVRDPDAAAPFDADVPGGAMIIYHIDESLAEREVANDGISQHHLRAAIVEADGDDALHEGIDFGVPQDLFPGPLLRTAFGPTTSPASSGYDGPSGVSIVDIATAGEAVTYRATTAPGTVVEAALGFSGNGPVSMDLSVAALGPALPSLAARVEIDGAPAWGSFDGDRTFVDVALTTTDDAVWNIVSPVDWIPEPGLPDDACTAFRVTLSSEGQVLGVHDRTWCWNGNSGILDFTADWPGSWTIDHPDGDAGTTWHRWAAAPWLTRDQRPVLVCTGAAHVASGDWPDVQYSNGGYATLTSGPLGSGTTAVRLVHAVDVEMLSGTAALDGGLVQWVGPDGRVVAARPLGGWEQRFYAQAHCALHGRDAFAGDPMVIGSDGIPLWRTHVIPVPEGRGAGPWRLRLAFASDTLWRRRGWVIARIDPVFGEPQDAATLPRWEGGLVTGWPLGEGGAATFSLQVRVDTADPWSSVLDQDLNGPLTDLSWPAASIVPLLPGSPGSRHELRLLGPSAAGPLATRPIVVYADGGGGPAAGLGEPWPNPAPGAVRFTVETAAAAPVTVSIYDVRGRRVHHNTYPAGSWLGVWQGDDEHGRRLPSGTYYLRLDGAGRSVTRKVVLLH